MTPLLKRMEKAGLVRRERDQNDERRVLVSLTPAGRNLRARALQVPEVLANGYPAGELENLRLTVSEMVTELARHRVGKLSDQALPADKAGKHERLGPFASLHGMARPDRESATCLVSGLPLE